MNLDLARKVADAVLYEGYMLYPYRPSALKNRQRWSFGILYPPAYPEVALGTERSAMHSEFLLEVTAAATIHVHLRFLHLLSRQYTQCVEGRSEPVSSLRIDDQIFESWDEPTERSIDFYIASLPAQQQHRFIIPASQQSEPMLDHDGQLAGGITRTQREVSVTISVVTETLRNNLLKLSVDVTNTTSMPEQITDRRTALDYSLLSAHTILTATGAQFVSLLDPPAELQAATASCRNVGNFPVLVGTAPERDMMLCSPIVLYDYPQIAPESVSDFYDATEMDEMLTLRVLTLTDDEKNEMRRTDEHVRNLLQRTEQSAREQLSRTHGVIRGMRPI
jgi:hydrogenase maturation protease